MTKKRDIMETKVTFGGKYLGQTLAHIAQFDPSYLDWMYANGLCSAEIIDKRDRGEFKQKKLSIGYAIVDFKRIH
jgi:hypothetical protein